MRILYVALKHDYGDPGRGPSFEHFNFFDSLIHMGHDILYFDFAGLMREHGREWMNRRLLEVARQEQPELMFTVLFRDELDEDVVREISETTQTLTLNWFCDDHWRFEDFSTRWAPNFNWVVTTAASAVPKYELLGHRRAIKSQWACNHLLYRRLDLPLRYDATFVGVPHSDRRLTVQLIRDAGIDIQAWGAGWRNGRLPQDDMIAVFNQSRINLNLSNSTRSQSLRARVAGLALRNLMRVPLSVRARAAAVNAVTALEGRSTDALTGRYLEQIKARNFEIPGCGGFTLTGGADNLDAYYRPGHEVAYFSGRDELVHQVRYYLRHDDERSSIAESGHRRTLSEHTYVHRFATIFERMGLPAGPMADQLAGRTPAGTVVQVR
jgi:spore maturation protein CgeB